VGRTPWSAADAPVGLFRSWMSLISLAKSGSGGTRADQGVRPTIFMPDSQLWETYIGRFHLSFCKAR
jgi:hypothetical protein